MTTAQQEIEVRFYRTDAATSAASGGKLADAEVVFASGPMAGAKLVGFVLSMRRGELVVGLPGRAYRVGTERRVYNMLRDDDAGAVARFSDYVLAAWARYQEAN